MEPPGHQRSMTSHDPKMIFEFLTAKNYLWAFKNHRNVFYSSQGTRWTLKFCCSSIRSKVIGDHGFPHFSALTWPQRSLVDLEPEVYISISSSRGELHARFFPRSSSSIRGETARGVVPTPPPHVPWKDTKWPVPARVKAETQSSRSCSKCMRVPIPKHERRSQQLHDAWRNFDCAN